MFKNPEIPTDNLYKFIAIFGLVLFSLAVYIFVNNQRIFEDSIVKMRTDHEDILFEKSQNSSKKLILDERIEILRIKMKSLYGLKFTSLVSETDYNGIKNKASFHNDYDKLKALELERLLLGDKDSHDENKSKKILDSIQIYSTFSMGFLSIVGSILMIIGFTLWYYKTQKYQDRQLKSSVSQS